MTRKVTALSITKMKAGAARREIPAGNGLYVIVQPSGKKSFALRYRRPDGRPVKLTLGNGTMTLAAARAAASAAMLEVSQGHDPARARMEAKAKIAAETANTLANVVEEYLDREGKKLRTVNDRRRIFDRLILPALGGRPIGEIERIDVVRLLDKIEDNNGPRMADMVLAILGKVFNWYAARSGTFRSPLVRGMGRCDTQERARSRTLTDSELRAVWKAADTLASPRGALVKFLLLTACRRSEAALMRESELDGCDWVLPPERHKTGKKIGALVRPLSAAALAVLASIPRIAGCPYVFSTDGKRPMSGFSWIKRDLDKLSGVGGYHLHDLRRTGRSLLSRAGVNADVAERCLGHVIGGVRGVYDRHEYYHEKKHAFEALAAQIARVVDPQDNVTTLRA
jgi:integrase